MPCLCYPCKNTFINIMDNSTPIIFGTKKKKIIMLFCIHMIEVQFNLSLLHVNTWDSNPTEIYALPKSTQSFISLIPLK